MTIGKGCTKWKDKDKERERERESSYEPYCQQYQSRKYRVDNRKCFFKWTSERMTMGPHLIYINYIALWLRFPIRHDVYLLFFSHFLSFIDDMTCEALLVYVSWLAKSTVSCHVKVILSSNTSFYTRSFISEEILEGHSSFSWVYNSPAPLNADKIKITPWFVR